MRSVCTMEFALIYILYVRLRKRKREINPTVNPIVN